MIGKLLLRPIVPLALAGLVIACSQSNTGDEPAAASSAPSGIDAFLLFPNPIAQSTGGLETDTDPYADAYYRAIDPTNAKDTLDKWKTANGFGSGSSTEHLVVFRDVKDLGYGRRMTGRRNTDGSVAFFVENYNVSYTGGGLTDLNVEAAIVRDTQWHVGTNAIEWSPSPCTPGEDPADCNPTVKFAKFYNFSSATGQRQLRVDLDGKGFKAMPGPCITCHGGRGDPLTPDEGSPARPRFPLVENSLSRKRGDVQARLHGQNVDSFQYSSQAGFSKAEQQAKLKDFNQWVLCTYPLPAPSVLAEDQCRVAAGANEWQGTAAEMIKQWYGGAGMPNPTFQDSYVPSGWTGNQSLYTDVVAPFCRTCHIVRGTVNQSDIDFMALGTPTTGFRSYADRIKSHVFDRGNMPLALIVYEDFWKSSAPDTLATYIDSVLVAGTATSTNGTALRPGRPIANPGPNRMVRTGVDAKLSAANSLFATSFSWTAVSGPTTPLITNPTSPEATFSTQTAGAYTVRLTVGNGSLTDSKDVVITVDDTFPDPSTIRFAQIQNVLQNVLHNGTTICTSCHTSPAVSPTPPIFYNGFDRNGSGGAADATDDAWFHKAIVGRVNLTEIDASPLLRKPSGNHHNGGTLFDLAIPAGSGLRNFSIFYNWILAGMPAGGVAANAGADTSETVTFSGSPLSASVGIIDGSQSIGPSGASLTYSWTVVSQPAGGNASPASPTSAVTTLNVQNVGVYVVQLQVSDGTSTDTDQRVVTVSENPITAGFTPPTGTTAVTFSGSPSRGNITLTGTSTGSPTSCRWQILSGPTGATLGTFPTIVVDLTQSCASTANLNVPFSAVGAGAYQVRLTASNIGSSIADNNITVTNGTQVTANIAVTSTTSLAFSGNPPAATISLSGAASSGVQPLSYSWSVTAQPSGATTLSTITTGASTSTLTAKATGTYQVRLIVTDAALNSATAFSNFSVTPSLGTTFAAMTTNFVSFGCTGCHSTGNPAAADPANNSGTAANGIRPSWENVNDVNGKTLWQRVFQRVVPGNTARSLMILNPRDANSVNNDNPIGAGFATPHGGGCQTNFGCGVGDSSRLTIFSNWVLDGGPPGN